MAKTKTKATVPAGTVDVEITADTRTTDLILQDFERALDPDLITDDLLRQRIYVVIRERARSRFEDEGDDVSGPWAALRPFTREQRRRGGFGAASPINVRYGAMRDHVLNRPPAAAKTTLGGSLIFPAPGGSSSNLKKVRVAQEGLKKPYTPARPVIGLSLTDMELVLLATSHYLASHVRGGRIF